MEAFSLDNLITYAYDLQSYQVFGAPPWGDSRGTPDRYDITAKAEGDATMTREQSRQMLQNLLAGRFQLKFHRETRDLPVFNLVVAKSGPKFKESPPDAQQRLTMRGTTGAEMTVTKGGMAQLARQFSNMNGVDRPVLDKTHLAGSYDYTLTWALDRNSGGIDPAAVSIALEEQLGLKLEPAKAPLEVWVIDHAEKPSEN